MVYVLVQYVKQNVCPCTCVYVCVRGRGRGCCVCVCVRALTWSRGKTLHADLMSCLQGAQTYACALVLEYVPSRHHSCAPGTCTDQFMYRCAHTLQAYLYWYVFGVSFSTAMTLNALNSCGCRHSTVCEYSLNLGSLAVGLQCYVHALSG